MLGKQILIYCCHFLLLCPPACTNFDLWGYREFDQDGDHTRLDKIYTRTCCSSTARNWQLGERGDRGPSYNQQAGIEYMPTWLSRIWQIWISTFGILCSVHQCLFPNHWNVYRRFLTYHILCVFTNTVVYRHMLQTLLGSLFIHHRPNLLTIPYTFIATY